MKKRYIAILITLVFLCLGTLILSLIFRECELFSVNLVGCGKKD